MTIDREHCRGCFTCADACPGGAMLAKGQMYTVEMLAKELLKDRAYFGKDGGVTLSGGEAMAQPESIELAKAIRAQGVTVAFDTCGYIAPEVFQQALENADIILYDLKLADSTAHKHFTGVFNDLILENFEAADQWARQGGKLWVRTPVIPGATDSLENIEGIARILQGRNRIERWELCAFNNLCRDKYERLGIQWEFFNAPLMTRAWMEKLCAAAKKICGESVAVSYTGALQPET